MTIPGRPVSFLPCLAEIRGPENRWTDMSGANRGEQRFLVVHLRLEPVDFDLALGPFFRERQKETDDYEQDRDGEQHAQNAVETLPDCGLTPRAEIAIARMFH